jgi:hypothetical protein
MKKSAFAKSGLLSKYLDALAGIARHCEKARRRVVTGQYKLERQYPEGAERLSIALSSLGALKEYVIRVIRVRTARGKRGKAGRRADVPGNRLEQIVSDEANRIDRLTGGYMEDVYFEPWGSDGNPLSLSEVAEREGLDQQTILQLVEEGEFPEPDSGGSNPYWLSLTYRIFKAELSRPGSASAATPRGHAALLKMWQEYWDVYPDDDTFAGGV